MTQETAPKPQYDNNMKGVLFPFKPRDRVRQDGDPNATGNSTITCPKCGHQKKWRLAAWTNTKRDDGSKYQSLRYSDPDAFQQVPDRTDVPAPEVDDDIPF